MLKKVCPCDYDSIVAGTHFFVGLASTEGIYRIGRREDKERVSERVRIKSL